MSSYIQIGDYTDLQKARLGIDSLSIFVRLNQLFTLIYNQAMSLTSFKKLIDLKEILWKYWLGVALFYNFKKFSTYYLAILWMRMPIGLKYNIEATATFSYVHCTAAILDIYHL